MNYLSIKLKNYKKIKSGLGLDELYIDFTKRKHKLCLIVGDNGSGKSTLLNAMSLYPDSSDDYIPGVEAFKEIYVNVEGVIYHVLIISGVKNGNRQTQKAFIEKAGIELNPNGNISSYKDIIESEFDLDPNTLALSFLSQTNRGIADKTPAERKKYVSAIVSSLDTYNGINKNLSKKATVYKSHINSIHNKINSIGNEEELKLKLNTLDERLISLEQKRDSLTVQRSKAQTLVETLDPDTSIQNKYQEIYDRLKISNENIKLLTGPVDKLKSTLSIFDLDMAKSKEENINNRIIFLSSSIQENEKTISSLELQLKEECETLSLKNAKLSNINSEFDYNILVESIEELKKKIIMQETIYNNSKIDKSTRKDEFITIINILKQIKNNYIVIKSNYEESIFKRSCINILNNKDSNLASLNLYVGELHSSISGLEKEIESMQNLQSLISNRPEDCTIDTCPFISQAININYNDIEEKNNCLKELRSQLSGYEESLEDEVLVNSCMTEINKLISFIQSNIFLLDKIPLSCIFTETSEFLNKMINGNNFDEIDNLDKYITQADIIESYQENKNKLVELEAEKKVLDTKHEMVEEITRDIQNLEVKIENMRQKTSKLSKQIFEDKSLKDKLNEELLKVKDLISKMEILESAIKDKEELSKEYQLIKDNISKIGAAIEEVNYISSQLQTVIEEIKVLNEDRDKYKYSLIMINEYNTELQIYQEKFEVVDTLRRYSSPSTGIQTLFISIYMNKTRSLVNDLIKYFFDGEFTVEPYVINESEFRIPCKKSGWPIDDISSCSTAQVCMIGMIQAFAMLRQSSSVFNIVKLDEIDGGLDYHNRIEFIDLLYKIIEEFGIDQAFLISHASESVLIDVDIIALKYNSDNKLQGNVIYNYMNNK